jgi:hypothetical protein
MRRGMGRLSYSSTYCLDAIELAYVRHDDVKRSLRNTRELYTLALATKYRYRLVAHTTKTDLSTDIAKSA